jgi:hypothetical protein
MYEESIQYLKRLSERPSDDLERFREQTYTDHETGFLRRNVF